MTPDRIPAALFAAALLASRREMRRHDRLRVIAQIPPFDLDSQHEANDALATAFSDAGISKPRAFSRNRLSVAAAAAREWIERKIFLMSPEDLGASVGHGHDTPETIFAFGDPSIAQSKMAAILNSRISRRVTSADSWIIGAKRHFEYARSNGLTLVSSFGTVPYCLVSRLAFGKPLVVVCDGVLPFLFPRPNQKFAAEYGDLFRYDTTLFISSFPPGGPVQRETERLERDRLVAAIASVLLVGEIRPNGNMDRLVQQAEDRNVPVLRCRDIETTNQRRPHTKTQPCALAATSRELVPLGRQPDERPRGRGLQSGEALANRPGDPSSGFAFPAFQEYAKENHYLIHFTRSCPGPWPGQTVAEYCKSLADGAPHSAHTGFDTLHRILEENLIRASSRLTRRGHPVVSLTECSPEEVAALAKWRRGLVRWSFEAYGVALPKESLFARGARPVIYSIEEAFQDLSPDLEHLFQRQGNDSVDWSKEREWRLLGDLVLTEELRSAMVAIVPSREEAAMIAREFGRQVALAGVNPGPAWPRVGEASHK